MPDLSDDDRMRAAIDLADAGESSTSPAVPAHSPISTAGWGVLALFVVVLVVGFIGSLGAHNGPGPSDAAVPLWRAGLGWTLLVAGVGATVGLFLQARRTGATRPARSKIIDGLTSAQRKGIRRQMQGKDAVVPAQLPVVRHLATTLARIAPTPWTTVAVISIFAGNAMRSDTSGRWYFVGFLIVVWMLGTLVVRTQNRSARAFLANHPTPAGDAAHD